MSEQEGNSGDTPTQAQPAESAPPSGEGNDGTSDGSIFPRPHMEIVTANEKPSPVRTPPREADKD